MSEDGTTAPDRLLDRGALLDAGTLAELKEVVELARAGTLKPIPIEQRPLVEVSRTLDELKAGTIVGRVVAQID